MQPDRSKRPGTIAAVALACTLFAGIAHGQGSERAATAEALFREGKALMDEGAYEPACPKLEASHRMDPAVGTLLNLAICLEKVNKTASAWANYLRAAGMARSRGQIDREQYARAQAAALEPRLTRIAFAVDEHAIVEGFVVKRDGIVQESATWATETPVDPGTLVITASAPGKKEWRTTVEVSGEGKTFTIDVPVLEDAPQEPAPAPVAVVAPASPQPAAAPSPAATSSGDTQRTVGIIVGGVGLAGLAVGSAFGLQARSKWNGADCPNNLCVSEADQTRAEDAKQFASISTWSFVAGGALMAAGAALWLTAPDGTNAREVAARRPMELRVVPAAGEGSAGLLVHGHF
jgi:hypothetical protein